MKTAEDTEREYFQTHFTRPAKHYTKTLQGHSNSRKLVTNISPDCGFEDTKQNISKWNGVTYIKGGKKAQVMGFIPKLLNYI